MLQLFSTNVYGFRPTQVGRPFSQIVSVRTSCSFLTPRQTQNGYLMSTFALVRAMFLTFVFPHIIDYGRKWYTHKEEKKTGRPGPMKRGVSTYSTTNDFSGSRRRGHVDDDDDDDNDGGISISSDPSTASSSSDESELDPRHSGYGKESDHQSAFDLVFLRWSCFFDALLKAALSFSNKGWQMYIGESSIRTQCHVLYAKTRADRSTYSRWDPPPSKRDRPRSQGRGHGDGHHL